MSSAPSDEGKENLSTLTESSETSPSVPVVPLLLIQPGQACGVNSTTLGTCEPQSRCALIVPDRNFRICVKEGIHSKLHFF